MKRTLTLPECCVIQICRVWRVNSNAGSFAPKNRSRSSVQNPLSKKLKIIESWKTTWHQTATTRRSLLIALSPTNIMLLSRLRPQATRVALRSFASEGQFRLGQASTKGSSSSNSGKTTAAYILGAAAALGAVTAGTVTLLEEAKYRFLPAQKYESPRAIPVKGPESHHAD